MTWLLLVAGGTTAGLSLLGYLGRWWWMFDLAAALRPQYTVVLLATGALLLAVRARRAALAILLVGLLDAASVAPLWLKSPAPPDQTRSLRVLFHNVNGGGDERFADVARHLASSDADVVFLSEMSPRWIELFEAADLPFSLVYPRRSEDHRRLMALSRVPIESVDAVPLVPGARSGGIAIRVNLDGQPLQLLALHTHSPRHVRSASLRNAEIEALGQWVIAQSEPVAVLGDLNATAWSHPFRRLRRKTDLLDSQQGFGLQPTWREGAGLLMIPLDHLLHDEALTVADRTTGPALGSSHRSLRVTLAWRADR